MLLLVLGSTIIWSLERPIRLMVPLNVSITMGFTAASLPSGTEMWLQPGQMSPNLLLPWERHREHWVSHTALPEHPAPQHPQSGGTVVV